MLEGNELVDHELNEGEFLELSELPDIYNKSELTIFLGSNEISDGDNSDGQDGMEMGRKEDLNKTSKGEMELEGNANLNVARKAQEIFSGLRDLYLLLGPMQAHQLLLHMDLNSPLLLAPKACTFLTLFLQIQEKIDDSDTELFLNDPNQVTLVVLLNQDLLATEPSPYVTEGTLSATTYVVEDTDIRDSQEQDTIIQLVDPLENVDLEANDPYYNTYVDEEIEIDDRTSKATSAIQPSQTAMIILKKEVQTRSQAATASSTPQGFSVKWKYLPHKIS